MKIDMAKVNNIFEIKKSVILHCLTGDYKKYANARKKYASYAIKDFELAKSIKTPKISVPLFSRIGLNILYVAIRDLFRRRTPDERTLQRLINKDKIRKLLDINT